jgi:hypothetical protein
MLHGIDVTRQHETWWMTTRDVMWQVRQDVTWHNECDTMWMQCEMWCDVTTRCVTSYHDTMISERRHVMWCDVMWRTTCDVMDDMWCDVMWHDVTWHSDTWCDVTWRDVARHLHNTICKTHGGGIWCDVTWRTWLDVNHNMICHDDDDDEAWCTWHDVTFWHDTYIWCHMMSCGEAWRHVTLRDMTSTFRVVFNLWMGFNWMAIKFWIKILNEFEQTTNRRPYLSWFSILFNLFY